MKAQLMLELVEQRKAAKWEGVAQVEDYGDGFYASAHVSPYTRSACNLDAEVFLMLQDWSSDDWLRRHPREEDVRRFGYSPKLKTNKNLISLLAEHLGLSLAQTYATNLFPFIKTGSLSHRLEAAQLLRAARTYGLAQVNIVKPKLVVCFGKDTSGALRQACNQEPCATMAEAIANPFDFEGVRYWAQAHPGGYGQFNRNKVGPAQVSKDWGAMADWLRHR